MASRPTDTAHARTAPPGRALVALATLAPPALAAGGRGITGPELVAILQAEGYKAKLETDSQGDPMVRTAMQGVNVTVLTYDCSAGRCGSLQLRVGLDFEDGVSLSTVNAFNTEYRYATASLDEENDPFLQYDFEVMHTQHAAHIASQLETWEDVLGAFLKATGFHGDDDAHPGAGTTPTTATARTQAAR